MKNLILFLLTIILFNGNTFGRAIPKQNYQKPTFTLNADDFVNPWGWSKNVDSDGDTYIAYPQICISQSSEAYKKIKEFAENFYTYTDKTSVLAQKDCLKIGVGYLSVSDIDFDVSAFPINTKFDYEIFYFSQKLPEQTDEYGGKWDGRGFGLGELIEVGNQHYRTFSDFGNNLMPIIDKIGLRAMMSEEMPIGIGRTYYAKSSFSVYEKAYLKSTIGADRLNINVDTGSFVLSDYFDATPTQDFVIRQFRYPFLASSNFGFINTVFLARLLITDDQVGAICAKYSKEFVVTKALIDEGSFYSDFIEKLASQNNTDIFTSVLSYYYESQKNIEDAIDFINVNFASMGVEKDLLVESLNAVSLLKSNSCLSGLTLEQLKSNGTNSMKVVSQCFQSGSITSVQRSLVEQLINLGNTNTQLSSGFQRQIASIARHEAEKKTKLLNIKSKFGKFYHALPSANLKQVCKNKTDYSAFKEIIK